MSKTYSITLDNKTSKYNSFIDFKINFEELINIMRIYFQIPIDMMKNIII